MSTGITLPPKVREIQGHLEGKLAELAAACSSGLSPKRQIQVVTMLLYRTPDLQECNPASVIAAVVQASSLGLDLSTARGEAYIVPRWNSKAGCKEATFMPGFRGLAKLAHRAGNVVYIQPELVHANDRFRVWRDPDVQIMHEMAFGDRGDVTHVYAVAKLASGDRLVTVLTKAEVEAIRRRSNAANNGPWVSDWGEMAKKTAVKRLCKSLPFADESEAVQQLHQAIEIDNKQFEAEAEDVDGGGMPDQGSGYGKGIYASPEQAKAYLAALERYIATRDKEWLDRWTREGGLPDGVPSLASHVTAWQADKHLLGWAVETKRLAWINLGAGEGLKHRQLGRLTAIVYHRSREDRKALANEMVRYVDQQAQRLADLLKRERPELFPPEVESQETPEEIADVDDGYQPWELAPPEE